jgi:hypothetical protein
MPNKPGPLTAHWDGTAWRVVPGPDLTGVTTHRLLSAIAGVSHDDVWAVGCDETTGSSPFTHPSAQHWDGTRWTDVPVPSPETRQLSCFTAVAALGPNDVWAVGGGADRQSYVEHWDGSAWTVVRSVPHYELTGVVGLRSNDVWALGYDGLQHWDGQRWTDVPKTDQRQRLGSIAPDGTGGLVVVGNLLPEDSHVPGTPLMLRYRDGHWSQVSGLQPSGMNNLSAVALVPGDRAVWTTGVGESGNPGHPTAYIGRTTFPH